MGAPRVPPLNPSETIVFWMGQSSPGVVRHCRDVLQRYRNVVVLLQAQHCVEQLARQLRRASALQEHERRGETVRRDLVGSVAKYMNC